MLRIAKYVLYDILRSKVLFLYTLFLGLISFSLFMVEDDASKALISLLSVILIVLPLVSIIFSTTYFYNAYEFMEMLVSQPIKRSTILLAQFFGVGFSLVLAFVLGCGVPMLIYQPGSTSWVLIFTGIMLTFSFTAFAFLASVATRDKARGIGLSLLLWFYMSIVYDAIVVGLMFSFSDYPLEKTVVVFASLNPIDLSRILVMLKLDISAMMGYTGALYREFFGTSLGMVYSASILLLWIALPLFLALFKFKRKNL